MTDIAKFEINGVIDTSQNVLKNIDLLATSSGCFVTWDPAEGKWSVIVNEAGTSVYSFDDSNIIGSIAVGGTGINDLYNSVQIEYPHKDLRDSVDYLTVTLPTADRYPQELDNQLTIRLNTINNPVQAQIIASQELKQNRVDKTIQFRTDFTANGLKAGDIIDVTNSVYDFTSKLFRIIQIEEEDTQDGAIVYSITALEYDADVYNLTGLEYDLRTKQNGIPSKIVNEEMAVEDDIDAGSQIGRLLAANAAAGLINTLFSTDPLTGAINQLGKFADADKQKIMEALGRPGTNISASGDYGNQVCVGNDVTISLSYDCNECLYNGTDFDYDYEITGVDAADVGIDLTGTTNVSDSGGSFAIPTNASGAGKTMTVTVGGNSTTVQLVDCAINPLPGTPGGDALPTQCVYVSVPVVWCGTFDGDTGDLIGITVKSSASFAVPQAGEATVSLPQTCSVSGGSISIDSTVDVASSSSLGGTPFNVITSFNSVAANGLITGTTTTVYGY